MAFVYCSSHKGYDEEVLCDLCWNSFNKDSWAVAKVPCKEKWMETESRDSKEEQLFRKSGSEAYWENNWGWGAARRRQWKAQCPLNPAFYAYPDPRMGETHPGLQAENVDRKGNWTLVSQTEDHNQISVQQKAGENEDRNTSRGRVLEEWKSKIPSFKARSEFGFHQSLVWW